MSHWFVIAAGLPILLLLSWRAAARSNEPWIAFARRTADIHALGLVLLMALAVQFADAHGITTDGAIYFSQLRSAIFDRDLDVAAEFAYLEQPPRPSHVVQIGPTIVWLPLYLAVAAVDGLGRAVGLWDAPSPPVALGLTAPYVRAVLVSSFAIGAVGLFALLGMLRREFPRLEAFSTTLLTLGATPLIWYVVYEPSMTHAASFGFVALFVSYVTRLPLQVTRQQGVTAGALLGLAVLSRPQEAVFALLPAFLVLVRPEPLVERVRAATRFAGFGLLGAAPWLLLQALHSYILFSREGFLLVGQEGYLNPLRARIADVLLSSWHGFLSWSPIAYIAVVGTLFYLRQRRAFALGALSILVVMAWVNGSTIDWPGGWSFGGRRFVSCLVVLAPGLALVVQTLRRRPMVAVTIVAVAALGWQHLLMLQYRVGMLPKEGPVSFGQLVRQQAQVHTRSPYFYPFAFPANAIFAWRHDLPIDRYDLLSSEPMSEAFDLTLDRAAGRFLMEGWGQAGGDQWGPVWWIDGETAVVLAPLNFSSAAPVRFEIQARTRLVEPPVKESLQIVVNNQAIGFITADAMEPTTVSIRTFSDVWINGFNRIRLQRATPGGGPAVPIGIYRMSISHRSPSEP
jgi:hypothetical protein